MEKAHGTRNDVRPGYFLRHSKLSFEEKIDILVRLQHLASDIGMHARGTAKKPWWPIDANGKRIPETESR